MTALRRRWQAIQRAARLSGELSSYIRPHRARILAALSLSVVFAALRLAEPWPLQVVFDQAILGQPSQIPGIDPLALVGGDRMVLLAVSALAILLLAVVSGSIYYVQSILLAGVGQQIIRDLREDVFHQLLRLSLPFHRRNDTGDLLMRMTGDMVFLREMILATLITMTSELIMLLSALVLMATVSWKLTAVTVLLAPGLFFLFRFFRGRMADAARQQRRREGRLAQQIAEVLLAIPMIQAFTAESNEDERFRQFCKRSERAGLRAARLEAAMQRMVEIVIALGTCLVLWFGVRQILAGDLTPGVFLVFLAYLRSLFKPIRRLSKVTERTSRAAAATERVLEVLRAKRDVRDHKEALPAPALQGAIRFEQVSYAYEDGTVALREIDLAISPGERVALVGPTGAGKSTLFSLILRFAKPSHGRVYFDGEKAKRFTLESLRRQIALLPQEPFVLGGTIRENLLYGRADATDEALWEALTAANLDVYVKSVPNGLDAEVASRGQSLSGGQKQRLAIARAILKDAPILLLDEPSTGLDPKTEREVLAALDRLRQGRTTITIAHRFSTVEASDRVLVLDRGRIVADGRPSVLAAQPGLFRELLDAAEAGKATPIAGLQFDPALKGIERLWRDAGPNRFLTDLAQLAEVDRDAEIVCLKQRLGQRVVLKVRSRAHTHFVKLVRGGSGDRRLQVHKALESFAPAVDLRVPRLRGWSERYRALVFEELIGSELTGLDEGAWKPAYLATGAALARVHLRFPVPENQHGSEDEDEALERAVTRARSAIESSKIQNSTVESWEPAQTWRETRACWQKARPASGQLVALHGDFYPSQVRVRSKGDSGDGAGSISVGFLDWDGFCGGDPERDVANFTAHLELEAARGTLEARRTEAAIDAFLEGYRSVRPIEPARFEWYRRGTLLRLSILHTDPSFGAHPPNDVHLPDALLARVEGESMVVSNAAPQYTQPRRMVASAVLALVGGLWALGPGSDSALAGWIPRSWGGAIAAVYESRPGANSDPIDPAAGTGDGRYWFAVPEEWGGSGSLWAEWKVRTALGRAKIEATYERNEWLESGVLARDAFGLGLSQEIAKRNEVDLSLQYTPQVYLRHRADKDARVGEPAFRPEAYANYEASLAFSRRWKVLAASWYGTLDLRDENRWFDERDRRGLGTGVELDWTGATTRLRPFYEFEVTRSRNKPDLGSDLSHREHALGLRWGQELAVAGLDWKAEVVGKWKYRSYSTDDPTDTSRYHRRDRTFYAGGRLLWSRNVWSPFVASSLYRRIAGNSDNETDDSESDKLNVRLGVEFTFESE